MVSTGVLWLFNLSASCTESKISVVFPFSVAVLIALAITALAEPSYSFNESWAIAK